MNRIVDEVQFTHFYGQLGCFFGLPDHKDIVLENLLF